MKGEFYKMEYEAWDSGTDDLTLEQEAAYLRVCHLMYRRGGPVQANLRVLAGIWRCHQNRAKSLLSQLVKAGVVNLVEGQITSSKIMSIIQEKRKLSVFRSEVGRSGGIRSGEMRSVSSIKRIALTNRQKQEIFDRDGYVCSYCKETEGDFHIDHITPVCRGGSNSPDNLCVSCAPCNMSKGSKLLSEWI